MASPWTDPAVGKDVKTKKNRPAECRLGKSLLPLSRLGKSLLPQLDWGRESLVWRRVLFPSLRRLAPLAEFFSRFFRAAEPAYRLIYGELRYDVSLYSSRVHVTEMDCYSIKNKNPKNSNKLNLKMDWLKGTQLKSVILTWFSKISIFIFRIFLIK